MAIHLSGSVGSPSDVVLISGSSTLMPSSITVITWFNPDTMFDGAGGGNGVMICKPYSSPPPIVSPPFNSWILSYTTGGDVIAGVTVAGNDLLTHFGNSNFQFISGSWNQIAFNYNAFTGDMRGYVNGRLLGGAQTFGAGNIDYNTGTSTSPVIIGGNFDIDPFGNMHRGYISDISIYNRFLSDDEIYASAAGHLKYPTLKGLAAYYPLDERPIGRSIRGIRILDRSVNNNFGTGSAAASNDAIYSGEATLTYR